MLLSLNVLPWFVWSMKNTWLPILFFSDLNNPSAKICFFYMVITFAKIPLYQEALSFKQLFIVASRSYVSFFPNSAVHKGA